MAMLLLRCAIHVGAVHHGTVAMLPREQRGTGHVVRCTVVRHGRAGGLEKVLQRERDRSTQVPG